MMYGETSQLLLLYAQAHNLQGGNIPEAQAGPMSRDQMISFRRTLPEREAVAFWLAWKTASRWADILALKKENFVAVGPLDLIVHWGATLKTSRATPFAPQTLACVIDTSPFFPTALRVLRSLRPDEHLTLLSTDQLRRLLRVHPPTATLSAHSIKRGALILLAQEAARGNLPAAVIPLIAKHKCPAADFPASTIRYVQDKASLARLLGTGKATRLL